MSEFALNRTIIGDCRQTLGTLPESFFQCCVTSPPYWLLRDYAHPDQIGMEYAPLEYVEALVAVFRLVRRTLRDDGTLWLNIGDSYAASAGGVVGKNSAVLDRAAARLGVREQKASKVVAGLKPKDLCGIPWRVAFALQADGWWLRSDVIWHKPNPMPESVTDRPTKAHEYVFMLAKSERYFYDADAIKDRAIRGVSERMKGNGESAVDTKLRGTGTACGSPSEYRNARTVWTLPSQPYDGAHFATMAERCVLAGSKIGTAVLDPFMGSGTTGLAAEGLGRKWLGCELTEAYGSLIRQRTAQSGLPWPEEAGTKEM